ncbi:hypothetical protein HPB50_000846 [Hyalomma asiaticum]|uniref:Uncharacterized protein n=1 Tax=Hyalomma asiaticum TaxID=266040 RepID=A0ACB7S0H6_HYAAI|nr:hypothetical protein HPB50_000846 [Hyalomma asiaticum]
MLRDRNLDSPTAGDPAEQRTTGDHAAIEILRPRVHGRRPYRRLVLVSRRAHLGLRCRCFCSIVPELLRLEWAVPRTVVSSVQEALLRGSQPSLGDRKDLSSNVPSGQRVSPLLGRLGLGEVDDFGFCEADPVIFTLDCCVVAAFKDRRLMCAAENSSQVVKLSVVVCGRLSHVTPTTKIALRTFSRSCRRRKHRRMGPSPGERVTSSARARERPGAARSAGAQLRVSQRAMPAVRQLPRDGSLLLYRRRGRCSARFYQAVYGSTAVDPYVGEKHPAAKPSLFNDQ